MLSKELKPKKHLILHQLKNGLRKIEETQLNNKDAYIKYQKEAIKIAESGDKFEIKDYANLYKATLHKGKNPSEYTYLDWDKPLSQQPEKIQKFFGYDGTPRFYTAGIDGIRYPQGSLSGGSGQGKNYVVFDENAITIEERKALGR
jgi:hypothetical protein